MNYRVFWTPQQMWSWFRDDGKALAGYCKRAHFIDCYYSLNVWPDFDAKPSFYDFGFDFDSPDIANSARDAKTVVARLEDLHVPYTLFFSGSKGIHVVVPHGYTGVPLRSDGGHVCRLLQTAWKTELNIPTLDNEIHGSRRMWRVPNTINSKKNLYKVSLDLTDLEQISAHGIDYARSIASAPRPVKHIEAPAQVDEFYKLLEPFIETANNENTKREEQAKERREIPLKNVPICILNIINDPAKIVRQAETWGKRVPSRNKLTFIAATFFRDLAGASEEDCQKILGEEWQEKIIKISSSQPNVVRRSTETCIRSVYESNYQFSCGAANAHGCECSSRCPLFRPFDGKEKKSD
jgi:hypothetical protein